MSKNAKHLSVMDAVRSAVERGVVNAKALAFALGWEETKTRTIYNWLGGVGGPDAKEVNAWLRSGLPADFKIDVASAQLAGSGLVAVPCDVECEGKSSVPDALSLNVAAANFAKAIADAEADGRIDQAELAQLVSHKNEIIAHVERIATRSARRILRAG